MTSRKTEANVSRREFFFETSPDSKKSAALHLKSVEEYLRDTPPTPLSSLTKAILLSLAILVGLLFILTLVVGIAKPKRKAVPVEAPAAHASVSSATEPLRSV